MLSNSGRAKISGSDNPQAKVFFDWLEVLVVVQELAFMLQRRGGNNAVVRPTNGNASRSQVAIDISCADEYSFVHWQHD